MHGDHTRKSGPLWVVFVAHLVIVGGAVWLLLGGGLEALNRVLPFPVATGSWTRRLLLASLSVVYLFRFAVTSFWLLPRRMEWSEVAAIAPWLAFIHAALAVLGGSNPASPGFIAATGVGLYVLGSYLNTASEWSRRRWKADPGHQGHLYTGGLFAWSMHVNYFGDVLLFTGFAMVAGRWGALGVPVLMALTFVFVHVPTLDAYLAERYGAEFRAYAEHTKRLIPGIW